MKKRPRTLKSFYAPALIPVTPTVQPNLDLNPEPTVGTGASNNAAEEIAIEPTVELIGSVGNTSQEQETSTQETPTLEQAFDIVADPGLRKPIDEYDVNIRDAVRREYLLRGPCQPVGHTYPRKMKGDRPRSFHDSRFKNHNWLECSVAKNAAFCFCCYLFKQQRSENYGVDAFINNGKNQRQSVGHSMTSGSKKYEEEYLDHIFIILAIVRSLLLQALTFCGHDESSTSSNKGNFLEFLD